MHIVKVKAEREYDISIGESWSQALIAELATRDRAAIIVSKDMKSRLAELPSMDCEVHYFEIPDAEKGKSTQTLLTLWDWLGAAGFTRSDLVVAIGGGATTDVAGYAAASWLRGIDWIAIPTTVAGMVDAAIGGKTAINSDYGKNLIGAFHSPCKVIVDTNWLTSLSDRDFAAGLAEVVKTGFISDVEILNKLKNLSLAQVRQNQALITELVVRSATVKAAVVSQDFKESFEREALNYGHTLAHAIERESKYSIRHGEAVSIGMAFMAALQRDLSLISEDEYQLHISILTNLGLPVTYKKQAWPELLSSMSLDKKSRGKVLRFVTLKGIGKTDRLENPDVSALENAYEKVSS